MNPLAIFVLCIVIMTVGMMWDKEQLRAFAQRWRWAFLALAAIDAVVLLMIGF